MNLKNVHYEEAHRRPPGCTGVYWVIEYDATRPNCYEQIREDDGWYVADIGTTSVVEIYPTGEAAEGKFPRRQIPLHRIAEVTRYPEVEAP